MAQIPTIQEMVTRVVATPSVSSTLAQYDQSNRPVVDLYADWLEQLGFEVTIHDVEGYPGKVNMVAKLGTGRDGLVLAGHTDTVPYDEALWQSDPFTLTERDDRWYGLGSCDMKSFLALCVHAASTIDASKLQHPLVILGTADEESSMSGARALTAEDLDFPKYGVIGEPTELEPIYQHKGIMMFGLAIQGSSGHSSNPALGTNAMDAAGVAIQQLCLFRDQIQNQYRDTAFEVAIPTLNLGCVHGGDNPNRICDHVDLAFDLRMLPGMNGDAIISEMQEKFERTLNQEGLSFDLSLLHPPVPPFKNQGQELVNTCVSLSGHKAKSVAFATEAPFLSALGIETVVLGPGSIDRAHQPDEFLPIAQIEPTVAIIRALIEKYCY